MNGFPPLTMTIHKLDLQMFIYNKVLDHNDLPQECFYSKFNNFYYDHSYDTYGIIYVLLNE